MCLQNVTTACGAYWPHLRQKQLGFGSEISYIFSIVCLTFWVLGPRVYDLQPNGDHHVNHKEILHISEGGNFQNNFEIFYA